MSLSIRSGVACLVYLALLLGAIVLASVWRGRAVSAEAEVTRLTAEARLSAKVLSKHAQAQKKTRAGAAQAAQAAASAIEHNKEWADQPVPEEVQRALR